MSQAVHTGLCFIFKTGSHSIYTLGWSQMSDDPPTSTFRVLALQVGATMQYFCSCLLAGHLAIPANAQTLYKFTDLIFQSCIYSHKTPDKSHRLTYNTV